MTGCVNNTDWSKRRRKEQVNEWINGCVDRVSGWMSGGMGVWTE